MITLNKTDDLTNYVGHSKEEAWQAVFNWFLTRGNVETYFNINGATFKLGKDKRGFYNLYVNNNGFLGKQLFNRTKKGLVEEMRNYMKFI